MPDKPSTLPHQLDVVVLTQREALIWHGLPERSTQHYHPVAPQRVMAPDAHRAHHHVRTGQAHHMHHLDPDDPKYFDAVAEQVRDATRILLVGHGQGRSNMAKGFLSHAQERHRHIAKRVIGDIDADLSSLTEPEIVELARAWYARFCQREG